MPILLFRKMKILISDKKGVKADGAVVTVIGVSESESDLNLIRVLSEYESVSCLFEVRKEFALF